MLCDLVLWLFNDMHEFILTDFLFIFFIHFIDSLHLVQASHIYVFTTVKSIQVEEERKKLWLFHCQKMWKNAIYHKKRRKDKLFIEISYNFPCAKGALWKALIESSKNKTSHVKSVADLFVEVRQHNLFCCWECRTSVTELLWWKEIPLN